MLRNSYSTRRTALLRNQTHASSLIEDWSDLTAASIGLIAASIGLCLHYDGFQINSDRERRDNAVIQIPRPRSKLRCRYCGVLSKPIVTPDNNEYYD
ncbi:hypothetical protein E4T56_gene1517 [Termitomyces sp. T112]|nr:hypothetical protein E4T56_gene1517 [Termitomyces sp. T112]